MKKKNIPIKLVITVALKKEISKEWFISRNIPVHTLEALKAGILGHQERPKRGMLIVVTGTGLRASEEAAIWIRENLNPLFVLNIGTCGIIDKKYRLGEWIRPASVTSENGDVLPLDARLPIPLPPETDAPSHDERGAITPPFNEGVDNRGCTREGTVSVSPLDGKRIKMGMSLVSAANAQTGGMPDSWKRFDAVDMECYAQAKVFQDTSIGFHCLKFGADYADGNAIESFNKNLELFVESTKKLFRFMEIKRDDPHPSSLCKVKSNASPPEPGRVKSVQTFSAMEKRGMDMSASLVLKGNREGPDITVIIPVYNREQTIKRAVDSVLEQTFSLGEIAVIDDGSTDGTREILRRYGDAITPIFLSENHGPSRARNKGIEHSRTEWVAFLDSDDEWTKDKLKGQVEYLYRYPFYEIMQSEEIWIRNGKRVNPRKYHEKPEGWIWERSLERCLISPSSVLVKKSLLRRYGNFNESFPVCEDYDLWLKISRHHPVGLEPSLSVIKYGGHADQLSRKFPAMDGFRVRSLLELLEQEHIPRFREKIIPILKKKLEILIQGHGKRGKREDEAECRRALASLSRHSRHFTALYQ